MKTPDNAWTDIEIKVARELYDIGASARITAEALPGRTRNSVIGMWHRQKFPVRVQAVRVKKIKRVKQPYVSGAPKAEPIKRKVVDIPMPESLEIGILDLKTSQCRYATTPDEASVHLFCGNRSARPYGSWCEYHQAVVHR